MFLRVEETGRNEWFFKRYRYKCDRCGKEFIKAKKDSRTKLCPECKKFDERMKARKKNDDQQKYIESLKDQVEYYRSAQEKLLDAVSNDLFYEGCDNCPVNDKCRRGTRCYTLLKNWSEEKQHKSLFENFTSYTEENRRIEENRKYIEEETKALMERMK